MSFFPFNEHELVAFTPGDKGNPPMPTGCS